MLFEVLDPALQAHLIRGGRVRSYANGEIIQQRGEPADGFWLIEDGAVMVGQFLRDGEFRAVALLGAGDSYGELAVFSGRPRIVDAISRGESKIRFIAAKPFLDALGNYPVATRQLLGALSTQLQDILAQLAGPDVAPIRSDWRVCWRRWPTEPDKAQLSAQLNKNWPSCSV